MGRLMAVIINGQKQNVLLVRAFKARGAVARVRFGQQQLDARV